MPPVCDQTAQGSGVHAPFSERLYAFAQARPGRARSTAVWLLAAAQTIGYACLHYLFAGLLFSWETTLGWAKAELTLGITATLIVAAFASPVAGGQIDAGRARWTMPGGMLLGALAIGSLSLVASQPAFVLVWALVGIAQALSLYDSCFAFLTRTMGDGAKAAIGRVTIVAGFASTLTFPSAAALEGLLGWRATTLVFAAVAASIGAPLLYAGTTLLECCPPRQNRSAARTKRRGDLHSALRSPAFWFLAGAFLLIATGEGLILNHIVPLFVASGATEAIAVAAASLFGPMQVAGRLALLADRRQRNALSVTLLAFCGIAVAIAVLQIVGRHVAIPFVFAVLFGSCFGVIGIIKPLVIAETLGRSSFGAISGALAVPVLIAFALGPTLGSVLWERGGYTSATRLALVLAVLACAAIAVLAAIRQRQATRD